MENDNIKNSEIVNQLRRLVDNHGGQHAAARALGDEKRFQSSISNSLAGKRMPSEALRKALYAYEGRHCAIEFLIKVTFVRTTPKFHLFKAESADSEHGDGFIASVYVPISKIDFVPPENTVAVLKLLLPRGE